MEGALQAAAHPSDTVNQGSYNTCVPTSMEFELARTNPSEYARLVAGLASKAGSVTTRGGSTLELQTAYLDQFRRGDDRLASSVLFQGAAMEFANRAAEYEEDLDQSFKCTDHSRRGREGLQYDEQARLGTALFGVEYMASGINDRIIEGSGRLPSPANSPRRRAESASAARGHA